MLDLFIERRYFKFQDEIQFSSNTIMAIAIQAAFAVAI